MKKVNRKIISILLLLLLIASQIGPAVVATENNTTETQTLEQYLVEHGVDEDGDKKINDAEWKRVKNLNALDEGINGKINVNDFTGIEKATNLERLSLKNCDITNINIEKFSVLELLELNNCNIDIDFSKLPNLKYLKLHNIKGNYKNIEELTDLETLKIDAQLYKEIDFNKLLELKDLQIIGDEKQKEAIKIPAMNIEKLDVRYIVDLDISQLKYLKKVYIEECTRIKVNDDKIEENFFEFEEIPSQINIKKDDTYDLHYYEFIKNENDNVAIFNVSDDTNYAEIKAKNIGTTNMTLKDIFGRKKTIKINVLETDSSGEKIENTGITAKYIEDNIILQSNGDLYVINSNQYTMKKLDTNVKDYRYGYFCYGNIEHKKGEDYGISNKIDIDYELVLKKNNVLNIRFEVYDILNDQSYNQEIEMNTNDVQELGEKYFLTTNGSLYVIDANYITQVFGYRLIKENVKKIITECVVLNDNTTWYINEKNGKYEFKKLADFAIKDENLYTNNNGGYIKTVIDNKNNLWCLKSENYNWDNSGLKILKENFDGYKRNKETYLIRILENGDAVLKEKNEKIWRNISEINWEEVQYLSKTKTETGTLIKVDGTIWNYDTEDGLLTRITESMPSDEEEDKNFLNPTAKIHEKELEDSSILYGISDSTKVEDFKKQNNFNSTYEVKIYDKNDKELQDNNIIGTGSRVKLYKQGKIIKEYTAILYGDTTGDGKITSVDALAVIKHINNKILLKKEEYIEAGRVRKESGKNLTSVDALAIVKSVNGKYEITKNK